MANQRKRTDILDEARKLLGDRRPVDDPTIDHVNFEVFDASAYVLAAAQPDAVWTCSLGHQHPRLPRLTLRPLINQAEQFRNEGLGKSVSVYSGSVWSLAVRSLQKKGLLEKPGVEWDFDITKEGRV